MRFGVEEMGWHGGCFGLSGDEQRALALGVALGQYVEQRVGQVGEVLACQIGGLLAQSRTARTSAPRRRRDPAPAVAARRSPSRSSWCTRWTARCAAGACRSPRRPRLPPPRDAAWPECVPVAVGPDPARQPGQSRAPARGMPAGRREPVCGRRFRDRRPERTASLQCTAAAIDAVTSPWVAMRRRRNARSVARSTTRPLVTASSTPPECTCPPVGSRESASASSVAKLVIRTGNTVVPSAVRWRAAPATPRRRCAR